MATVKALAKIIQTRWPSLRVEVERGYCNTDFKPKGLRYITRKGKGRWGSHIRVWDAEGRLLLSHNNAETYRRTQEIVDWMERYARGKT